MSSIQGSCSSKKFLVRNVEQKKGKTTVKSYSTKPEKSQENYVRFELKEKKHIDKINSNRDYTEPELNSTKNILKQIKKVQSLTSAKSVDLDKIEGAERVAVEKEITKKLNFHFNDAIYKDLVALNISDSDAAAKVRRSIAPPKYVTKIVKDIEPNLDDFYQSIVKVDQPILPTAAKVKYSPIIKYNGRDIHEKILSWKS